MEQRKLNDQANTLVDFAKVNIFHDFETVEFENRELFCCTIVTHFPIIVEFFGPRRLY